MENWTLLISFVVLLTGVFVFKKLWLGTLAAIIIVLTFKISIHSGYNAVYIPLTSGFVISLELTLLLFGAYLFHTTLSSNNHFASIIEKTSAFSSKLSSVIILCLFIGSFMEGIAGFGIPAMLVAPLMLAIGFKPLTSIVLPLAANTTAVTFGALGTPLKIGLGITSLDTTVLYTVLLNILPAIMLPFILAFLYSKTEQIKVDWIREWKMLLGAGFCFLIPYSLTGLFSIEFPSVVAGVFGLITFVFLFIPKKENPPFLLWLNTFYPYFLFVILLLIAKLYLDGYYWKTNETLKPLSLYQPGIIFILSSVLYLLVTKKKNFVVQLFNQSKATVLKISKSIATIILLACFAQLIQSDMTLLAHSYYSELSHIYQLFITPVMGVIGSFITGSATMNNLLLSGGVKSSVSSGIYMPLLLALLHIGGAVGNAISFQNILMVKAVINCSVTEAKVIRYNILVVGFYLLMLMFSALIIWFYHEFNGDLTIQGWTPVNSISYKLEFQPKRPS